MYSDWFEVAALALRYWYILLAVIVILRAFFCLLRDRADQRRRLQQLPDAGLIGELITLNAAGELDEDLALPVPREGILGSLRLCDVVAPAPGVAARHAELRFVDDAGLFIYPYRPNVITIDGHEIVSSEDAQAHPMLHGSVLQIGELALRLRVFAGVRLPQPAAFREDAPMTRAPLPEPVPTQPEMPAEPAAAQAVPVQTAPQPPVPDNYSVGVPPLPAEPVKPSYMPVRPLVSVAPQPADNDHVT